MEEEKKYISRIEFPRLNLGFDLAERIPYEPALLKDVSFLTYSIVYEMNERWKAVKEAYETSMRISAAAEISSDDVDAISETLKLEPPTPEQIENLEKLLATMKGAMK